MVQCYFVFSIFRGVPENEFYAIPHNKFALINLWPLGSMDTDYIFFDGWGIVCKLLLHTQFPRLN